LSGATEPLLAPLSDQDWPAEVADLRVGFAGQLNVYRVMAHRPTLLRAWENFRNYVVLNSSHSPPHSEIVILRVGHRWGSSYEWLQHVVRGRAAGLTAAQIESARHDPLPEFVDDIDNLLMRATDVLIDAGALTPELIHALDTRVGAGAVFDIIATVGMYTTLAFLVKSFRTPIEPDIAAAATHISPEPTF
jgi:4-carboxymuconolactone decarboxylase